MARKQSRRGRSNSSNTQGPIRILHLSDLHLCPERNWASEPILTGLAETIGRLPDAGLAPDVVAITGDIANRRFPARTGMG
jgi:3',5'-cyclic AMP phosphodiesterase CpdA